MKQGDSSRRLLVFKKALYKVKANSRHLRFNIFGQTPTGTYNEKTVYHFRLMIQRYTQSLFFYEKVWNQFLHHYFSREIFLEILFFKRNVSGSISREIFLVLYSINQPDFIIQSHLLLEILGNKPIVSNRLM